MDKKQASKKINYSKKALEYWEKIVKLIHGRKCALCGSTGTIAAHHLLSKERNRRFKYSLNNGLPLCLSCHRYGYISAHNTPEGTLRFFIKLSQVATNYYQFIVAHLWDDNGKYRPEKDKDAYIRLKTTYEELLKSETNEKRTEIIERALLCDRENACYRYDEKESSRKT